MSGIDYLGRLLEGGAVAWRPVSEIFHLRNGYTPSKSNREHWADGTVPWFRMEDIRENGRILADSLQKISVGAVKGGKLFPANSIIVATSATIGEHALITVPYLANQRFTCLALKPEYVEHLDIKFIFYYCFVLADWCRNNTTTSSFASVDMDGFKKFLFPIPCPDNPEKSLAIQAEIVRTLDTFTELTAELTAKLTAELTARARQYSHYRDQLLRFEQGGVEWKPLGTVTTIRAGQSVNKQMISANPGEYPVINSGREPLGFIDEWNADDDPIGITSRGAGVGSITWRDGKYFRGNLNYSVTINSRKQIDTRFLYHLLLKMQKEIQALCTFDGIPALNARNLKELQIPIPPLLEQARIVAMLDKFDALTSSIRESLPREIELRQKEYSYYRDLLLGFPRSAEVEE